MSTRLRPAARAAVVALDAFGAVTPRQARQLLGLWARRDELTDDDVAAVLAHYEPTPPTAEEYEREDPETRVPLPRGVEGWAVRRGSEAVAPPSATVAG